jgi:hypothetical protein
MHEGHIGLLQQFVTNSMVSSDVSPSFLKSPCLYRLKTDGGIEDEQAKQSVDFSSSERRGGCGFVMRRMLQKGACGTCSYNVHIRLVECLGCPESRVPVTGIK